MLKFVVLFALNNSSFRAGICKGVVKNESYVPHHSIENSSLWIILSVLAAQ